MRQEWVRVKRRTTTDDGAGGSTSNFHTVIQRYFCRLSRAPVEKNRRDQSDFEATPWFMLGDPEDIREQDKIESIERGMAFHVTRVWHDKADRRGVHLEARLRQVEP